MQQYLAGMLFDLDSSDRSVPEEDVGEDAASGSGEQVKGIEFHAIVFPFYLSKGGILQIWRSSSSRARQAIAA